MSSRLRIATYNIHKCRGLDRRTSPERIAEVIAELDADVVALQEILDVRNRQPKFDQVRRIKALLKDYHYCFGENRRLYGGAYGNMTLSRFPIEICRNYDLTWRHRERRGCLRTDILLPKGKALHIFNVHLGTSFTERRHQARTLVSEEVLRSQDWNGPRVVLGDFNEWTRGLATSLMTAAFDVADPRTLLKRAGTYHGVLPFLHLDHFYYDKHLVLKQFRLHRNPKSWVSSDHLPLSADFELKCAN
jgi:endonuclease/exonuclease/phosphatase family metal-dependent hydrolase